VLQGEAVEGAHHRQWHAPGIGGIEDLKRTSGKNLLSVEQAACTPDIYIGGQSVAHFFWCVMNYF
jgi:hypothetical protein